jgi:hypothetical protein
MRRSLLAPLLAPVLALALAMAATSCQSGSGDHSASPATGTPSASGSGTAPPTGAATPSSSASTVAAAGDGSAATITDDQLVALLAGAGIATYDDATDAQPEQAVTDAGLVKLTGWQLQNMRRQLNSGRGYLATDLDALTADTGAGAQPVPLSIVLAAWISAAQSPAAEAARQLVGASTAAGYADAPFGATYPDAVVTLFVSDVAGPAVASGGASPAAYLRAAPVGACSAVQGFIDQTFASIVSALTVEAGQGVTGVLGTIWNVIVSIAAAAAQIALGVLTSTLLAPVRKIIAFVAILSTASSLLTPWQVTTKVAPDTPLQPGTDAEVDATVDPGTEPWPADLSDCASTLADIPNLPDPGNTAGSTATWKVDDPDQTVTYGATKTTIDAAHHTAFKFSTDPEDPALASGDETTHAVDIGVTIDRAQVDQLSDLINNLILGVIPGPILAVLNPILGPLTGAAREKLAELASEAGPVTPLVTIRHEPPPEPPPAPGCTLGSPTTIPIGKWTGPLTMSVVGQTSEITTLSNGQGTIDLTVAHDHATGHWGITFQGTGTSTKGGETVTISVTVHAEGPVSGTANHPHLSGQYHMTGTAHSVFGDVPVTADGPSEETMQVASSTCDEVTGDLVVSFNTHDSGAVGAVFSGNAQWLGHPVS